MIISVINKCAVQRNSVDLSLKGHVSLSIHAYFLDIYVVYTTASSLLERELWVKAFLLALICLFGLRLPDERQ